MSLTSSLFEWLTLDFSAPFRKFDHCLFPWVFVCAYTLCNNFLIRNSYSCLPKTSLQLPKISSWKLYDPVYLYKLHVIINCGNIMLLWPLTKNSDLDHWLSTHIHHCPWTFTLATVADHPTVNMSVTPLDSWGPTNNFDCQGSKVI